MATQTPPTPATPAVVEDKFHSYPFYAPRFWHGMRLRTWLKLVARNHFKISPLRWFMCVLITPFAMWNSVMYRFQQLFYGKKIRNTQLADEPVFIVGHWRSGTTYLHELFMLDDRLATPTTHECFVPHHALLTRWMFYYLFGFALPKKRPMDNVSAGWDRPQEDEFALCNMGLGSPYTTMAFPNNPPQDQEYLTMEGMPDEARERWKAGLLWFMKLVTVRSKKRVVMKSPTHTARIKILLEMFPGAKFVHIARDPKSVIPSTIRLWKSLYKIQGCQTPKFEGLEEHVMSSFERMYEHFERDRILIPTGNLFHIRYEDLVKDPLNQIQAMYAQLKLGDFEVLRPKIEAQLAESKDYKTNKFNLSPEMLAQIATRCGAYCEKYGYSTTPAAK